MIETKDNKNAYLGNPLLKRANVSQNWTKKQLLEYSKCMEDPLFFIQNYVKIVSLDEGLVPFKMYDFQKEMVGTFHNNRFTICKLPRQSGKSTIMISYLLHYALFNDSVNIAILANKASTARDLLGRHLLLLQVRFVVVLITLSSLMSLRMYHPMLLNNFLVLYILPSHQVKLQK